MQRPPLIVIQDPAHRRAIGEHHAAGRIDHGRRRVRRRGCRDGGFRSVGCEVILGLGPPPLEHGLFDRPQAAHLLPHPNLGMAVGVQDGLGHIAEGRTPPAYPTSKVPQACPRKGFGPLPGLLDQASDLVLGCPEQRLSEPHSPPGQLPHDGESLVSLLGLEAVDAENDLPHGLVASAE